MDSHSSSVPKKDEMDSHSSSVPKKDKKNISSQEVIKKLKDAVRSDRTSAIGHWVRAHYITVEDLTVEKSDLLCNVFCDESCWSGTTIDVSKLVGELAKLDFFNPFAMYEIACINCVENELKRLFDKALKFFISKLSHRGANEVFRAQMRVLTQNDAAARIELLSCMRRHNPVFDFWIDIGSGNLKEDINARVAFNRAVDLKWSKGVEHFYNRLCNEQELKKEEQEQLLISTITKLSSLECCYKVAATLNFLLGKIINIKVDPKLLLGLSCKKQGGVVYCSLYCLVQNGFFHTTKYVVQYLSETCSESEAEQMLLPRDYAHLLSTLSFVVYHDNDLNSRNEARSAISILWKSNVFDQNKLFIIEPFKDIIAYFSMESAMVNLIIDLERSEGTQNASDGEEAHLIINILRFVKDHCSDVGFETLKLSATNTLNKRREPEMVDEIDSYHLLEELFDSAGSSRLPCARIEGPQSSLADTS